MSKAIFLRILSVDPKLTAAAAETNIIPHNIRPFSVPSWTGEGRAPELPPAPEGYWQFIAAGAGKGAGLVVSFPSMV